MANTCLFIGRFQPFHKGHLMVVQGMRKVCGRLIIGIGSPEKRSDKENPFSVDERREMIGSALLEANIADADILECPNTPTDAEWVSAVLKVTGPIDQVWTGNELVATLFEKEGVAVKRIKPVPGISGTEIRARLASGGDWEALVPDEVASVMKRLNATQRV